MPVFDKSNIPRQPCQGVYKWYIPNGPVIYVGRAGAPRKSKFKQGSTLFRGVSEAVMNHSNPPQHERHRWEGH